MNQTDPLNLGPGDVLDGRYVLEMELGRGGMGVVFAASDRDTDASVAIKLLRTQAATRKQRVRFFREARVAAQIRHPNVVQILDYALAGEDIPYLVMELVRGISVEDLSEQPFPAAIACDIAVQMLRALGHVHAAGIVHRDIKPGNLLVSHTATGQLHVRIGDFGVARLVTREAELQLTQLTGDGQIIGTPAYMAPEQALGAALIGPTADLYSVGVCLYVMLAGYLPFTGTPMEVLVAKIHQPLPPPANIDAWPEGLWSIVSRLAATRPEDRYPFAADALAELVPYARALRDEDLAPYLERITDEHASASRTNLTRVASPTLADAFDRGRWREIWGREDVILQLAELTVEVEQGEVGCALITGAMGQGKSILVTRLARNLAEDARFRVVRVDLGPSGSVLIGLRTAVESMLGGAGDDSTRMRQKLEELLSQHGLHDPQVLEQLLAFVRPDDAAAVVAGQDALPRHVSSFVRLLRCLASQRPVLLILDDLDQVGSDGVSLLRQLLHDAHYEPFCLLIVTCAKSSDTLTGLDSRLARDAELTRIELAPLITETIIDGLLADYGIEMESARRIALRAGGNPYFASLLAQTSIQELAVAEEPSETSSSDELPDQLRRVVADQLEAQLERLGDREAGRALLARLAILGPRADVDLLEQLAADNSDDFDDTLDRLIEVGVLAEELDGNVVAFAHELVRDVILDKLTRRRFRKLHKRAADLRVTISAGSDEQAAAIGHHLHAAGATDRAVDWWLRGLAQATRTGDLRQVLDCGQRVLDQLAAGDPRTIPCCVPMAHAHRYLGNLEAARRIARLAVSGDDPLEAARALEIIADCEQERNQTKAWERALEELDELAADGSDEVRRIRDRSRLFWLNITGQGEEALGLGVRMLEDADTFKDASYIHGRLFWGWLRVRCDVPDRALLEAERYVVPPARDEVDDPEAVSDYLRRRCLLAMARDRPQEVWDACEESIEIERNLGRWGRLTRVYVDRAFIMLQIGSPEQLERALEEVKLRCGRAESASDRRRVDMITALASYVLDDRERQRDAIREIVDETDNSFFREYRGWSLSCLLLDAADAGDWETWCAWIDEIEHFGVSVVSVQLIERVVHGALDASFAAPSRESILERLRGFIALANDNWAPALSPRLDAASRALRRAIATANEQTMPPL